MAVFAVSTHTSEAKQDKGASKGAGKEEDLNSGSVDDSHENNDHGTSNEDGVSCSIQTVLSSNYCIPSCGIPQIILTHCATDS